MLKNLKSTKINITFFFNFDRFDFEINIEILNTVNMQRKHLYCHSNFNSGDLIIL